MAQANKVLLSFSIDIGGQQIRPEPFDQEMVTIGKGSAAVLQIEDPSMADLHCAVQVGDDGVITLLDLGSEAGTFLNGARINNSPIKDGDEIRAGGTKLKFGLESKAAAPAPVAAVVAAPAPVVVDDSLADPKQVIDVMVRGGTEPAPGAGPKVLEVSAIWFNAVMNVRHFTPDVKQVVAGDNHGGRVPFGLVAVMTILVSGLLVFAWKGAGIKEPPAFLDDDKALIEAWKKEEEAASAAALEKIRADAAAKKAAIEAQAAEKKVTVEEYQKELDKLKAEEEAKAKAADPLLTMTTKFNEEAAKAYERAAAGAKENNFFYQPIFRLFEQPNYEVLVKEQLLPYAREKVAKAELSKEWIEELSKWTRKYDILEDIEVPRFAEDLVFGTRIVKDGARMMIVQGTDAQKVFLADDAGKVITVDPTSELTLWSPDAAQAADREAVFKEIQQLLYQQAMAKRMSRAACSAVEQLITFDDGKDLFAYNGQWAACLAEQRKWEQARPFAAKALETMPAGAAGNDAKWALAAMQVQSELAMWDAFGGDPKIADPHHLAPDKRKTAEDAAAKLRAFARDTAKDYTALGAVNEHIYLLGHKAVQEAAGANIQKALFLCILMVLLMPVGVGFDYVRARAEDQHFFVPGEGLPGSRFVLAEQQGGTVRVNFTKDSVGWLEKGKQRTSTSDLIKQGKARDSGGLFQLDLNEDEAFVHDIGKVAFYVQKVHPVKPSSAGMQRDFDWMFLGVLLFLLAMGGLFAVQLFRSDFDAMHESFEIPDRFVELNIQQVEKEKDKPSGNPDAGEGAKAKGDEGKVGKQDSKIMRAKGSKVAVQRAQLDRQIAENSGLMAALRDVDQQMFAGGGLGGAVSDAIGGLIGAEGTQYGSGGLGARGSGWGGGGTAEGIGGLGMRGSGQGGSGSGKGGGFYGQKGGGAPGMGTGDPIIVGSLDRSIIDRIVRQHLTQIRYCYQKELNKNPKLFGKVKVKFTISRDGSVSQASMAQTTLGNPIVEDCIAEQFRRMRFPAPKGGGIVMVQYPFVFNSQGG